MQYDRFILSSTKILQRLSSISFRYTVISPHANCNYDASDAVLKTIMTNKTILEHV